MLFIPEPGIILKLASNASLSHGLVASVPTPLLTTHALPLPKVQLLQQSRPGQQPDSPPTNSFSVSLPTDTVSLSPNPLPLPPLPLPVMELHR